MCGRFLFEAFGKNLDSQHIINLQEWFVAYSVDLLDLLGTKMNTASQ